MNQNIEALLSSMARMQDNRNKMKAIEQKVLAAGFTDGQWMKIATFREEFDSFAGALAYCLTAASQTGDKGAAEHGIATARFMARMGTETENTLTAADVPLEDFGMRDDMTEFRGRMDHVIGLCQRVLAGEDLSQYTARELTAGA